MTSPSTPTRAPFSRLPRRTGAKDALVVLALLGLCGAFVAEILPVEPAADRLYELEAGRDFYARAAAARAERVARAEAARPAAVAARSAHAASRPAAPEAGAAARDAGAAEGARPGCVVRCRRVNGTGSPATAPARGAPRAGSRCRAGARA